MIDADRADAAWYWKAVTEAAMAWWSEHPDDDSGGPAVQDLCTQAVMAGVTGRLVDVGEGVAVPLHELLAPYRTRPGGLAERSEAERRRHLDRPVPPRFGRWEW